MWQAFCQSSEIRIRPHSTHLLAMTREKGFSQNNTSTAACHAQRGGSAKNSPTRAPDRFLSRFLQYRWRRDSEEPILAVFAGFFAGFLLCGFLFRQLACELFVDVFLLALGNGLMAGIVGLHLFHDGGGGADGGELKEFHGNGIGGADAAVGEALAGFHLACVHADAVCGQAHPVGHGGAVEAAALGQFIHEDVCVGVDALALGVVEVAVAVGGVLLLFLDDAELARGSLMAADACGDGPVHSDLSVDIQAGALLLEADEDGALGGVGAQELVVLIHRHGGGVFRRGEDELLVRRVDLDGFLGGGGAGAERHRDRETG